MTIVYTIGYESTDIDRFVATLKTAGIKRVADVRAVALSRKYGFSKKALAARLEVEKIQYLHFVELGDPRPGREAAREGRYDEFRDIYEAHLDSADAKASLRKLLTTVSDATTCLLCFERDPGNCHRSIVAEQLKESGFEVFDLYTDYPASHVRNTPRRPRYHPRQGTTAA
ncbi:MAG: DUF488 domain-containing protein [Methylocella sp.]